MTDTIIELVCSAGERPPVIASRETRIPGQWGLDICHGGAVVQIRRARLPAPKSGELVECLQVVIDGQTYTVVPETARADFVAPKRRAPARKASKRASSSTKSTERAAQPAQTATQRPARRAADTFAGYRDGTNPRADVTPSVNVEALAPVVGSVQFAPSYTASEEPKEKPVFGLLWPLSRKG